MIVAWLLEVFMDTHTTSDERLAAICQMIRNETLDPALKEAEHIKQIAEREAARIRADAKQQAEKLLHEARQQVQEEKEAFEASLHQSSKQLLGILKEQIERDLFNPGVDHYLSDEFKDAIQIGALMNLILDELTKEGISGDLAAFLGKNLNKDEVVKHILKGSLDKLSMGEVRSGHFAAGVVIKVQNHHLAIEITPEAIREIIVPFLRPDFRRFLFNE
jgi:V/A-type H+/Na+-transporting ATPase subunit E